MVSRTYCPGICAGAACSRCYCHGSQDCDDISLTDTSASKIMYLVSIVCSNSYWRIKTKIHLYCMNLLSQKKDRVNVSLQSDLDLLTHEGMLHKPLCYTCKSQTLHWAQGLFDRAQLGLAFKIVFLSSHRETWSRICRLKTFCYKSITCSCISVFKYTTGLLRTLPCT